MADFKAAYEFKADNKEVVIQNKGGGAFTNFLRVSPNNDALPDPSGGRGNLARWIVEKAGGQQIRLKSKKTGKYLRIKQGANGGDEDKIDVGGGQGKWTVFKVKQLGQPGYVKLESAEQAGKYLAVQKDNVIRVGGGGPWCELRFFREAGGGGGGGGGGQFTKPYMFAKKNTVVIQHRGGAGNANNLTKFLRVNGDDAGGNGGKGAFAQWEAEPSNGGAQCRFKSLKTGKYLRIKAGGNDIDVGGGQGPLTLFNVQKQGQAGMVKLQSNKFQNAYIAVKGDGSVKPGGGGPFTKLMIWRI